MGDRIEYRDGRWVVPDHPIIPFIEGDGTGPDIWRAARRVFDAVVEQTSRGERRIEWLEILAGEKAFKQTGSWLPDATLEAIREHRVAIKGPLTTPVGGGIRSLNVALRQLLDLYACVRPVRYFEGVPSPMRDPQKLDVVIFRENIEDVYSGIEYSAERPEAEAGNGKGDTVKVIIKDRITDAMFAQLVLRPDEYSVIASPNLNGDLLSDAAAAQVGGLGLAPGGNVGDGFAVFEATHGTAPKYAGLNKINPSSVILSGAMMFEELGWTDVAQAIVRGLAGAIRARRVTYDLARLMPDATEVSTSDFG